MAIQARVRRQARNATDRVDSQSDRTEPTYRVAPELQLFDEPCTQWWFESTVSTMWGHDRGTRPSVDSGSPGGGGRPMSPAPESDRLA